MPDMVSLPQLLDLSLGTPEVGAVNFNNLHKLLLEIINKLDLAGHPVPISLTEAKKGPRGSKLSLSDKINQDAEELIGKIKTNTPLTDLWQHMQVTKRVESNEDGIKTAMALIEKLVKDMDQLKSENQELRQKLDKIDMDDINKQLKRLDQLSDEMKKMSELTNKLNDVDSHKQQLLDLQRRLDALPLAEEIVTWPGLEDALKGVKGEFAAYRPESRARLNVDQNELRPDTAASGSSIDNSLGSKKSHPASRPRSTSSDGPSIGLVDVLEKLGTVDTRHEELKKRVEDLEQQMKNKANKEDISLDLPEDLLEQINDMQNRLTQLDELRAKDADAVKKLQNAMFGLRDDLTNMQNSIDAINFENKEREKALEQLAEKASKLEKEKADKESMEAELDTKADKSQVDGKLNRSLFDSTVADLQKMIDDLLSKLHAYEDAWKQAHSKVEEDVDGKIDRTELDRLKAYIDRKLRDLNTKIKNNSEVFNPFCEDAAGLKRQLLPFNCLSCDKPVVINSGRFFSARTPLSHNNAFGPLGDAFSANKSSRPYTTFELDQIRQHAKRIYNGEVPHIHSLLNADYVMDYYSTPRTAGGSHTMTYPYKRSTKHGYNRELFNNPTDEIPSDVFMPVRDETEIVGADGHVYRGRFDVTSGDPNPTPSLEVPAAPPSRPKSSPARRSGNNRPGNMTRPKTAQLQVKVESSALPVKKSDSNEGGLADVPTAFDVEHTSLPEQRAKE